MTDKPDNQFRSAIVLLVIAIAFISGVVVGGVLTAYEVTRSIEAMGNLFDKVQIGNVTIDLNETEITQTAINYIEREKTLESVD